MTTPHIHLHEYTRAEVETMEAGALMDWLGWQAMGAKPERAPSGYDWWKLEHPSNDFVKMIWDDNKSAPCFPWDNARISPSTDPGAAMGALKWLAPKVETSMVWLALSFSCGEWVVEKHDSDEYYTSLGTGTTPELAIARALLVYGLEQIEARKVNVILTSVADEAVKGLEEVGERLRQMGAKDRKWDHGPTGPK